jgi:hypothetical protein
MTAGGSNTCRNRVTHGNLKGSKDRSLGRLDNRSGIFLLLFSFYDITDSFG